MEYSAAADVGALCEGLRSPEARAKYGAARELRRLAEQDPVRLYGHFDFFVGLMAGEARVLRWNAARILGHLARADSENRIAGILEQYLAPITGGELIGAANTIQGAAAIAVAKPELAGTIAAAILQVKGARYATPECRNIAAGHAIQALDQFFPNILDKKSVLRFVEEELANSRAATRKKAEKFWKRWGAR